LTGNDNLFMLSPMSPRKLFNFYIDPDLAEGLKALKAREREAEGAIVRRALRRYLELEGVLKKSGPRRVSPRRKA
jgi:hypothetical protein